MNSKWIFLPLFWVMLILTACKGESTAEEAAVIATPPPPQVEASGENTSKGTFLEIREVGLGPNGFIALTNFTDVPTSLAGLSLCQASQCFGLPDALVDPGKTVRIAMGDGSGLESVVATRATLGELRPSDGEMALYASLDIKNPKEMLYYLQWGSTPHELTKVAVEAGLWIEKGYAPTSLNATRLYRVEDSGLWLFEEP